MRVKVFAAALVLSWATASFAQTASAPAAAPAFKLEVHGFASGTVYAQDGYQGPGEGGIQMWNWAPYREPYNVPNQGQDRMEFGGDVRQTRFNFSVSGPTVFGGATPKGVLEIDFYNNSGGGSYGDVSITPRMRLGYAELNWGAARLQFGQNNDLIVAMIPVSLAHIAFPVSYGSGTVGWRRPGIFGYYTFGDLKDKDATKVEVAVEVGRGQWNDAAGIGNYLILPPAGDAYGFNLSEASGVPAVEARVTAIAGQMGSFWVAGHYQRTDMNGTGNLLKVNGNSYLDTELVNAGGKVVFGPLTVSAAGYYGQNTAPEVGAFLQFQSPGKSYDVTSYGGWVQAGFNFTKELSIWGQVGDEETNYNEAMAAGFTRLGELTYSTLLQYRDGGFAVGFEWFHFHTKTSPGPAPAGMPAANPIVDSNQFMLTGNYFF